MKTLALPLLVVSVAHADQLIQSNQVVRFKNQTITQPIINQGTLILSNCTLTEEPTDEYVIYNLGSLVMRDTLVSRSGGNYNVGTIWNEGHISAINCRFINNKAFAAGVLLNESVGSAVFSRCHFIGNNVSHTSGAIMNLGKLSINESFFFDNGCGDGVAGTILNYNYMFLGRSEVKANFGGSWGSEVGTGGVYTAPRAQSWFFQSKIENNVSWIRLNRNTNTPNIYP